MTSLQMVCSQMRLSLTGSPAIIIEASHWLFCFQGDDAQFEMDI